MSTQTHSSDVPMAPARRCVARSSRTGQPCAQRPIKGGTVCVAHGGRAPQVKRKALERIQDMLAEAIDPNRVLREAARLAYSDIRELFDADGKLIDNPKNWPDNIARAVASIEQEHVTGNVDKGDGKRDQIIRTKVRLWDKPGKLQDLMKMHGQLTERVDHSGALEIQWKGEEAQGVVVDAELTGNKLAPALPSGDTTKRDSDL